MPVSVAPQVRVDKVQRLQTSWSPGWGGFRLKADVGECRVNDPDRPAAAPRSTEADAQERTFSELA